MGAKALLRGLILRTRIHRIPEGYAADPHSLAYLYIVQQRKRLSLATTVGRLRLRNILLFPIIGLIILIKIVDLWIANQIIRSMINEYDLLKRIDAPSGR
ncbi:hypothetical protein LJR251_003231 [Rhizobium rhizogenes]|jgi:hypothetical protein|uniref:hypothetical protein n=1 Tax=Rhizobium rhizogenes TaxID=359 RepID=UPI0006464A15|nr:hypothetical protein [Rhizobium rhizogenes]